MKILTKKIALKSCFNIFKNKSGYIKLIDQASKSTLFFKRGRLSLTFYREAGSYEFKIGNEAVENLGKGTFFDGIACFTGEPFVSEMEEYFPEAYADTADKIKYPEEEEIDEILKNVGKKESVKKELVNFLEDFISEHSDELEYINKSEIKNKLDEHLNSAFPDLKIDERIYDIINGILENLPKRDIKKDFEDELSVAIKTESDIDENIKEEMTSIVSDLATDYIKDIKEPIESKRQIKEKSIEYFSEVISDHLKDVEKLSPFERSIHLKELVLKTPVGDMDARIKQHLEILKQIFIKKLDLIKRCHLCGKQIKDGFLCEDCKEEYREYRSRNRKLRVIIEKIERLYISEKIDEEEYKYLTNSAKEKLILLQKSGKKFTSLKEYVNL